jgi:hypothetical protein
MVAGVDGGGIEMTFADFKAWKIAMHRRDIERCRAARAKGRHGWADYYLGLAGIVRRSLQEDIARGRAG